ncbi:MAG: FAD-dependent oxidoreductase [Candidatus Spyradocola sp.]|jgi:hypothetical protein
MLFSQDLPERAHYDVLVAGGGLAGVAAAVAAARAGKRVLLLEKSQKLGGLATLGLINLFVPMCNGRGKQIIFGMTEEFLRLSIRNGYGNVPEDFVNGRIPEEKLAAYRAAGKLPPRYVARFSPEIFALELTALCAREGVDLRFDALLTRAAVEETGGHKRILGVVVEEKSGASYYGADMFVDATGDGDLMARAGLPTAVRGNFHTYLGLCITLESCALAAKTGNIGAATGYFSGGEATLYGEKHPEGLPLYDGTSADEVNRYLVQNQLEMLRKLEGQDRLSRDIVTLPGMCQFRTTRRIEGDYVLQESDAYRHFDDSIAAICDFDRRDYLFEVPRRTIVRSGWDNLVTAGRSAAGEGYAWDVLRVIPPAILTGQAAGLLCCQALDESRPVASTDIRVLQAELAKQNVLLHFDDADVPEESASEHEHND